MKISEILQDYKYLVKAQFKTINTQVPHEWRHKENPKADIVLIAGLYERWTFLKPLGEKLHQLGYRIHRVEAIRRNKQSIPSEADKLHAYLTKNQLEDVIVISHSKGGLVALYSMLEHYPTSKIIKLIAIAAPFSGSNMGRLVRVASVKELLPKSKLIKYLNNELSNKPLDVVSVFPNYDNHVWHQKGSILDFAENIEISGAGHHKVLADEDLHKRIIKEVQEIYP